MTLPAETQLEAFIDEYEPHIGAQARAALAKMRALVPGAVEMVYDNYNALVIGYGATERPSAFVCSLALYPRWVTLFFADGARLPDPTRRLTGSGKTVRSIRLAGAETLDEPDVRALLRTALERSETPFDPARPNRLVIRSVSAKRRPRRP